MTPEELQAQFDEWALTYDQDTAVPTGSFPFAGYAQALTTIWQQAAPAPGMSILDLGVGTGNLSRLFIESGCRVLGADFSSVMLAKTKEKFPQQQLVQVDLTAQKWPPALNRRFDRIVSNYTFHEFPFPTKLCILTRLAQDNLAPHGRIIIGDITFPTRADLDKARTAAAAEWEEEHYWIAAQTRAALQPAGWRIHYNQLSICAGVYTLTPPTTP